jgi:molybdopterin converting factor small subunit
LDEKAMNIEINVKLHGAFKKHAPDDQTDFMLLLEPGATLGDVLGKLSIPEDAHVALVNGRRIANDVQFENGATLVLFPPLSGG